MKLKRSTTRFCAVFIICVLLVFSTCYGAQLKGRSFMKRNLDTCDLTNLTKRYAGNSIDTMNRLIVDTDSSVYIGASSYSTGSAGKQDSLIIKLSSSYTQQWGSFYGGSDNEGTADIDVSTNGLYVVGYTMTAAMSNGGSDIFILKLSKTDGSKSYAKLFGSTSDDYAIGIQILSSYIYVVGYSNSAGWTNGGTDFILFKLDESTGTKQWAARYGGPNNDIASDLIVSGSLIYVIGYGDLGISGDDFVMMTASATDGSLSLFKYLGGATNAETSSRMKIDSSGYLYMTGGSSSAGLTHGFYDIIIMKVNPSTYAISWGVYVGSSTNNDYSTDILLSSDQTSVYIIGYTDATGITFGSNDILMIKASTSTGANQFVIHCGGDIQDYGRTLFVESTGKILIGGDTTSSSLSLASTSDLLVFEIDSKGQNQCSNLQRGDITGTLLSTAFSTSTFIFKNYAAVSGTISDDVKTASGDTLTSSSTSFSDVCSNYYPVIATEGLTTPQTVYQDTVFSITLTQYCDTSGSTLTYTLLQSGGTALPTWMTFTSSTRTVSGIPPSTASASYTLTYTSTDNSGSSASSTLVIKVDKKPVLTNLLSDQTARTLVAFIFTIPSNTFVDPESDPITYTLSGLPSWATYSSTTQKIAGTPSATDVGDVTLTVICTDSYGGASTTSLKIFVVGNIAPIVQNSIPDQKVSVGTSYSYTFAANTFYDGNNDAMTYTMTGNPSWLSFSSSTRTLSGTPPTDYAYNITITASDAYGGSASDVFLLVLGNGIPNNSPVVSKIIPDQTATALSSFTFTISSGTLTDADGDNLALTTTQNSGSALPSWLAFNSITWTYGGNPRSVDIGSYVIKVTASDGKGGSCSTTFTITVSPYSSSLTGIAIILIIIIIIIVVVFAIVMVVLYLRRRKMKKRSEIESDSSSDEEIDEIVDKTGTLTQYLANTHTLSGRNFVRHKDTGYIYQKKALNVLLTPQESVKNFFKTRYGFDYDDEKGMFTATSSVFDAGFSSKKFLKEIEANLPSKIEFEEVKETPQIIEETEEKEDENEEDQDNPKLISKKIVVKAHHRKGKQKHSKSPKQSRKKSRKSKRAKSKSPKVKEKIQPSKNENKEAKKAKSPKVGKRSTKQNPKSPKSQGLKSKNTQSPKSRKTQSPKSRRSRSRKNRKSKSPKANRSTKKSIS